MTMGDGKAEPIPAKRKGGLGRGLDALLGDARASAPPAVGEDGVDASPAGALRMLPVSSVAPHPDQPRRHFDEAALNELAESIAEHGVLQPIVVRPSGRGYQIVAGERRWRAAQRARLHEIPAVVREVEDRNLLELALIENIQRADLSPIEEAEAYQALTRQHGYSATDLARRIDKSRSHVANMMRLLDLPSAVRSMVSDGRLSMGHARPLIGMPEGEAIAIAEQAVRDDLTVRKIEQLVRKNRTPAKPLLETKEFRGSDADRSDLAAVERHLSEQLGIAVTITPEGKAAGHVRLRYSNLEQLDMLIERLTGFAL